MGNCFASHHRAPSGDERYIGVDFDRNRNRNNYTDENEKELRDPFSIEKLVDPSEHETFSSDVTAPLSPDSAILSLSPAVKPFLSLSLAPLTTSTSLLGYDSNTQLALVSPDSEADDIVSPLSSEVKGFSTAIVPSGSPHRKGRALQARLQKARHMQMALATPSSASTAATTSSIENNRNSWDGSPLPERSNSSRSLASSTTNNSESSVISCRGDDDQQEFFDASVNAAWAELELDSAVLCTALSRTPASLSKQTPPLHIAVGTELGSIVVQELLQDNHLGVPGSAGYTAPGMILGGGKGGASPKLGRPVSVQLEGRVRSLDFSPDGVYLAAGGDDCKCHIYQLGYEVDDDDHLRLTMLHWVAELERVDRVYAVQFSPDGKFLAIGGFDGTVAIVATADISSEMQLEAVTEIPREGLIMAVDWSPDGRYLAIGGSDRCCAIVDCQQSWNVFREIRRTTTVQALKWYPTGKFLAIGSADTVAIVVGRDSFALMNEIDLRKSKGKRDHAVYKNNATCWSPNGSYFVVSGQECTLYETKKFTVVHRIPRTGNVTSVVWGQQNSIVGGGMLPRRFLAIGGEDRKVVILLAGLEGNMMSGGSSIGGDDFSSAAGSSYVSTRGDWVLKENAFQDVEDGLDLSSDGQMNVPIEKSEANVLAVAFSKGSKSRPSVYFAHSTNDGLVTIRFCSDWKVVAEIQFPKQVETMAFSNGSRFLALGCDDSNIYVSDTSANWELVAKIEFAAPISSVQYGSKNNERLVVGSVDGTLAFLDPRKGYDFAGEIEASDAPVVAIDWTSRNLAVGRNDGTVAIYDSDDVLDDSYVSVADLERDAAVCAVSFGVSSRFLAVGDAAGFVGIYSSKGGWVMCHVVDMGRSVSSVLWCPLGRHLAFVADNGAMKVIDTIFWADVIEAESSSTPSANGDVIRSSLAFSQDGRLLAFSRSDRGLGILDSGVKWAFALNMLAEPLTEIESDPEEAQSSISSREGNEEDGLFEV